MSPFDSLEGQTYRVEDTSATSPFRISPLEQQDVSVMLSRHLLTVFFLAIAALAAPAPSPDPNAESDPQGAQPYAVVAGAPPSTTTTVRPVRTLIPQPAPDLQSWNLLDPNGTVVGYGNSNGLPRNQTGAAKPSGTGP